MPSTIQLMDFGTPGNPGENALRIVEHKELKAGQGNVTDQLHKMGEKSAQEMQLRLKLATLFLVNSYLVFDGMNYFFLFEKVSA